MFIPIGNHHSLAVKCRLDSLFAHAAQSFHPERRLDALRNRCIPCPTQSKQKKNRFHDLKIRPKCTKPKPTSSFGLFLSG